ncbi:MAG: tetratricopeptide repeat protein, partial [Chloroflexi bacterium]|nr:tetratricopeptide repeat protein [Chloroflexota bacterium]
MKASILAVLLVSVMSACGESSRNITPTPDLRFHHILQGGFYYNDRDCQRAAEEYSAAIKLDPEYSYAYEERASVYLDLGEYEKAIQDFSKFIRLEEAIRADPPEYYRHRLEVDKQISDLRYRDAYAYRGVAYALLDQSGEAQRDFDRVVELTVELEMDIEPTVLVEGLLARDYIDKAKKRQAWVGCSPLPETLPNTPERAIEVVRNSREMFDAMFPYERELDWTAEWALDRWWILGLFESPWGKKFVISASLGDWQSRPGVGLTGLFVGIEYEAPAEEWVSEKAEEWELEHLYTRFTPDVALSMVSQTRPVAEALSNVVVVDAAAELVEDTPGQVVWRFAFYVDRGNLGRAVLSV